MIRDLRYAVRSLRNSLGARPSHILRLVVADGLVMALTGFGIGLAGAAWLARYLGSQLYAVSPFDPPVYGIAALLLALVAAAACLLPARRPIAVGPVEALRRE
jgi:putative ABC transport system permease protein